MGHSEGNILFLIAVALLALLFLHSTRRQDPLVRRRMLDALIDALNNFRGGPPTPMHPSPADDGALLRRRSRKNEN